MIDTGDLEIITYGGGELLRQVFIAISMLFYGGKNDGGFVYSFCVIAAMIGGTWTVSKCFFEGYTNAFFTKYFFPILIIPSVAMIPQARVHIIDLMHDKPLVVDKVPLLLAKVASLSCGLGYQMTCAIEGVMHTPNDIRYSKTGMVFGADTMLDFQRLKPTNATIAQNLDQFAKQCIVFDIALGRYSLHQMNTSSDLLEFLKKNTSRVRMIPYMDPNGIKKKAELISCQEAIDKMLPFFEKDVAYYTKHEILKHIPCAFNALTQFKANSENNLNEQLADSLFSDTEDTCKQMISVNAIKDATSRFATKRAKDNMRTMYQTTGALAGTSLITTRIVIEALIYASFAIILPLTLLPGGMRFLSSWFFLIIWIQLWPPLYAILNFISIFATQQYVQSVLGGISNTYSLFTSTGLQDLAGDVAATASYLSLSVPVISFYILQNLQSLTQLPGSLISPVQSSAATASTELSTGNYSFANTNVGQFSHENQNAFQHNTSPLLSTGAFTENYGTHSITHGDNGIVVNQNPSNLDTSISIADAYSLQLHKAEQNAKSQVDSSLGLYSETVGVASRNIADLTQHVAQSESYSTGYSSNETLALQESANYIMNASTSWGEQHGVSERDSCEHLISGGFGFSLGIEARGVHSQNVAALSDDARQEAKNIFSSQDFQEHFQRVLNYARHETVNNATDEGSRYTTNCSASMENLQSTQQQYNSALSELNQVSENLSYIESNSSTVNQNLNSEFSNWLSERGDLQTLFDKARQPELDGLRDQFVAEKFQSSLGGLTQFVSPGTSSPSFPQLKEEWSSISSEMSKNAENVGLGKGQPHQLGESVTDQYESNRQSISQAFNEQHDHLDSNHEKMKDGFQSEYKKTGINRLNHRTAGNVIGVLDKIGFNQPGNDNHLSSSYMAEGPTKSWFEEYAKPSE